MELDSRIKAGKRPLTCFDVKEAEKFRGEDGYFAHEMEVFENLDRCYFSRLLGFDTCDKSIPFAVANASRDYEFFIPEDWVKEPETPEFEQYTLDTWGQDFKPGDVVFFRGKEDTPKENNYYKCMYLGYLENENNRILVILGPWLFTFFELFELYEIYRNGTWEPFGRKANEG